MSQILSSVANKGVSIAGGKIGAIASGLVPPGVSSALGSVAGMLPGPLSSLARAATGQTLGILGDVVFMSTSFSVRTWETLTRKTEASFAEHAVIGQKTVSEFAGAALDTIEFEILLNGCLGVDPLEEADKLREMTIAGEPQQLVLGGQSLGKFTLRGVEEEWKYMRYGKPLIMALKLNITEFIDTVPSQAQQKQREDELKREDTGKGGPDRLPGSAWCGAIARPGSRQN